jgi:crotonobetainyl-CoA:carnitine CoA-transferase CaiB-like acyl-CoA transferase
MAAFGTMAALHERERSGEGQMVDISMADGALSWLAMVAGRYFCDEEVPRRGEQQLAGGLVCYLPYEAADGWVTCGALEPKFWAAFCNGVDRPELVEKQFEAPGSEAWQQVAEVFRSRTRDEWKAFNDEHDCCIEPVLDLDEALDSELVRARGMLTEVEQPELGTVRQLGSPVKLSRTPADPTRPAPAFGEHTDEVLAEAGYSAEEVAAMKESGAAAGPAIEPQGEFRA